MPSSRAADPIYVVSANAWPGQSGDVFADWIDSVQKYVVSDTLTEADITWHPTTIIRGRDFLKTVADLRARPGGYISVYGSPTMVRSLLAADLVDELVLSVVPLVIGSGKKLFSDMSSPLPFELVSAATASTGAMVCRYRRPR